ncbi:hypothetical protein [Streptomyces sp. JHA26]|uniref:LppU/SCO3897 family protein n=1 Tax=Streptomyces sp. JHA26 TaxID=1917143 RepID=UPI0015C579D2|nr:hypothetical protein [Streptomyces sp. JHA26]
MSGSGSGIPTVLRPRRTARARGAAAAAVVALLALSAVGCGGGDTSSTGSSSYETATEDAYTDDSYGDDTYGDDTYDDETYDDSYTEDPADEEPVDEDPADEDPFTEDDPYASESEAPDPFESGTCLNGTLPDSTTAQEVDDVEEVDCSASDAHYRVIQTFPMTSDMSACDDNPRTEYAFSYRYTLNGAAISEYVYCLVGLGSYARS